MHRVAEPYSREGYSAGANSTHRGWGRWSALEKSWTVGRQKEGAGVFFQVAAGVSLQEHAIREQVA